MMLSSARFVTRLDLRPPAYGFERLFSTASQAAPSAAQLNGPVHTLRVLEVNGTTGTQRFASWTLRVDLRIRGAQWRTSEASLCTALSPDPEQELRRCSDGAGRFTARLFVFVPSPRPRSRAPAPRNGGPHELGLREALRLFERVDLCDPEVGGTGAWAEGLCRGLAHGAQRRRVPILQLLVGGKRSHLYNWTSVQQWPDDWRAVGAAFVLAARTLPQPFTVVEAGNLCGL